MKLEHLNAFRKIVKTGSFTRAAQELFVTQPTITNHIQTLENELGFSLFVRSSKSIRLTAEGEELAQKVENLFLQIENLHNIGKNKDTVSGDLVVAASSVMGTYFLPPVLKRIAHEHEAVNIHVHFGNAYRIATWVQDGFIDAGFAPWIPGFPTISFHTARIESCVLVASAEYFNRHKARLTAGDFSQDLFILREKGSKIHDIAIGWMKKYPGAMSSRRPLISSDMESIKNLVLCHTGLTIIPHCCVEEQLQAGTMRQISTTTSIQPIEYYLIHKKNERWKPLAALLITELQKYYNIHEFKEKKH